MSSCRRAGSQKTPGQAKLETQKKDVKRTFSPPPTQLGGPEGGSGTAPFGNQVSLQEKRQFPLLEEVKGCLASRRKNPPPSIYTFVKVKPIGKKKKCRVKGYTQDAVI